MNQDTRNKKNAKYQQNLQKRYGLTKSSDYKSMCSKVPQLLTTNYVLITRSSVSLIST